MIYDITNLKGLNWVQLTFTCDSVIPKAYANFALSGPARYFVCSKVFSSAKICWPLKVGRVCFFLPSLSEWLWCDCDKLADTERIKKWERERMKTYCIFLLCQRKKVSISIERQSERESTYMCYVESADILFYHNIHANIISCSHATMTGRICSFNILNMFII